MKPYFTKYLPVEGEIQEGDLCILDEYICIRLDKYFHIKWKNSGKNQLLTEKESEKLKKVKLFLCSRDIQVGDKCFCLSVEEGNKTEPNMWIDPWRVRSENDTCKTCIKVIGEVSPDALSYVKEGDEFDTREIRQEVLGYEEWYKKHDKPVNNGKFKSDASIHRYSLSAADGTGTKFYYIKGPCGHFH